MKANDPILESYITARDYVAMHILAVYCNLANIGQWDANARLRAARAAFRMADSFIEASQEERE